MQVSYFFKTENNTPFVTLGTAFNFYRGTKESFKIYSDKDNKELNSGKLSYKMKDYNGKNVYVSVGGGYKHTLTKTLNISGILIYNMATGRLLNKSLIIRATTG